MIVFMHWHVVHYQILMNFHLKFLLIKTADDEFTVVLFHVSGVVFLAVCVYQGVAYKQGDTWNEGCIKKCRCDDASKNIYTCFDR